MCGLSLWVKNIYIVGSAISLGGFEFDGLWLLVLTGVRVQDSGLKLKPQHPQPQKRQATHL